MVVGASWFRVVGSMALVPLVASCVIDVHIHVDGHADEVEDAPSGFEVLDAEPGTQLPPGDARRWMIPPGTVLRLEEPRVVADALWRPWEWEDEASRRR